MFYSRIIVCLSVLILLTGCIQNSKIESALVLAGSNRSELEAVLNYYTANDPNPQKLRAAEFLIENMPAHYSYAGNEIYQYYDYAARILTDKELTPEQQRDSLLAITDSNMSQFTVNQTTSSTDFNFYDIRPCIARILSSVSSFPEDTLLNKMIYAKVYNINGEERSEEFFQKPYDAVSSAFYQGDIILTFDYSTYGIGVGRHTFVVDGETNIGYTDFPLNFSNIMEGGPAVSSASDNSVTMKYHKAWVNVRIPKEQIDALAQLFN